LAFTAIPFALNLIQFTAVDSKTMNGGAYLAPAWMHHWAALPLLAPALSVIVWAIYEQVPRLFSALVDTGIVSSDGNTIDEIEQDLMRRLGRRRIDLVIAALVATALVYWVVRARAQDYRSWMHAEPGTLTSAGIYWIAIVGLAGYVGGRAAYCVFAVILELRRIFRVDSPFRVSLKRLHPDGCLGLEPISAFAFRLSLGLFVLGLMIATMISAGAYRADGASSPAEVGWFVAAAIYLLAAPMLFFSPLLPAHRHMRMERDNLLLDIAGAFERCFRRCESERFGDAALPSNVEQLKALEHLYDRAQRMPVWPFSFLILAKFGATVVLPVLFPVFSHILIQAFM
jgi:hypothetical protein